MAILNNGIPTNLTEYPNSFKRQGAFPLEAYSVFYDIYNGDVLISTGLEEAIKYAKKPIAYVGQEIVVVSQGAIRKFIIANESGGLVEIATAPLDIAEPNAILSVGFDAGTADNVPTTN